MGQEAAMCIDRNYRLHRCHIDATTYVWRTDTLTDVFISVILVFISVSIGIVIAVYILMCQLGVSLGVSRVLPHME